MVHYRGTECGFEFGSAKVTRKLADTKTGWVCVGVDSPKMEVQVYVTRTGKIRVFSPTGEEWVKPKEDER